MKSKPQKLAILFAMQDEGMPLVRSMGMVKVGAPDTLFPQYLSKDKRIVLSFCGKDSVTGVDRIGTDYATANAYNLIESHKPDLIINAGVAGGFHSQGAEVGRVYLTTPPYYYHDRRIPVNPNYEKYASGSIEGYNTNHLSKELELPQALISTGNSIDYTDQEMNLMLQRNIVLKDMEAAALASVCRELNVPFFALKAVTDLVDEHDASTAFVENFNLAVGALHHELERLIRFLMY